MHAYEVVGSKPTILFFLFSFIFHPYFVLTNGQKFHKIADERRQTAMDVLASGSVPVRVAARVYGKDPCWVRAGIISGWLPIGTATRNGKTITNLEDMNSKLGRINYYISPKKLMEETGFVWKGEKN